MYYYYFRNPSDKLTMVATFDAPWNERPVIQRVPPSGDLVAHGAIRWDLWTFTWQPLPRKGLMRFRR